jgi:hypothetical protein
MLSWDLSHLSKKIINNKLRKAELRFSDAYTGINTFREEGTEPPKQ